MLTSTAVMVLEEINATIPKQEIIKPGRASLVSPVPRKISAATRRLIRSAPGEIQQVESGAAILRIPFRHKQIGGGDRQTEADPITGNASNSQRPLRRKQAAGSERHHYQSADHGESKSQPRDQKARNCDAE